MKSKNSDQNSTKMAGGATPEFITGTDDETGKRFWCIQLNETCNFTTLKRMADGEDEESMDSFLNQALNTSLGVIYAGQINGKEAYFSSLTLSTGSYIGNSI